MIGSPPHTDDTAHRHPLPPGLRGLLHGAVDQLADPRHAGRQSRRCRLCAARQCRALPPARPTGAAGGVWLTAAVGRHVRRQPPPRGALAGAAGVGDHTCRSARLVRLVRRHRPGLLKPIWSDCSIEELMAGGRGPQKPGGGNDNGPVLTGPFLGRRAMHGSAGTPSGARWSPTGAGQLGGGVGLAGGGGHGVTPGGWWVGRLLQRLR